MVTGVNDLFSKTLIAEGVGYKFQVDAKNVVLSAGFSHTVDLPIPEGLTVKAEGATKITISGIDREKVGFYASQIRDKRPPEPYKGKGILYQGEHIIRKAGKTGR
jgi:large subunit ribosomal protein L6